MAAVGNTYLTLADVRRRQDPNDQIAHIVELLAQTNPAIHDAVVQECNDGTSHLTTVRTGIPTATWRQLYQGVQPTKSTTMQVRDTVGMAEAWSEVDSKLVELSTDPAGLRLSEATAFLEGMNNAMESTLWYGDQASAPAKFTGIAPRLGSLSAASGSQIVDAGGTGSDNTSIYIVGWAPNTVHLLFPKGSNAGLQREDKGKQTKTNSDGSILDVHREKFSWDIGLSVRDWRYLARVANIDVSDLTITAATGANLMDQLTKAYWKLHRRKLMGGNFAIYCNATVMEYLDHQSRRANSNVHLTWSEASETSEPVLKFRGMPIRQSDAILNTEARVV
jgi:hypothetical protein